MLFTFCPNFSGIFPKKNRPWRLYLPIFDFFTPFSLCTTISSQAARRLPRLVILRLARFPTLSS